MSAQSSERGWGSLSGRHERSVRLSLQLRMALGPAGVGALNANVQLIGVHPVGCLEPSALPLIVKVLAGPYQRAA